jgi:phage protein D
MGASTLDGSISVAGKARTDFSFTVTFPTLPSLTAQPQAIRVIEKPYNHDIVKLSFDTVSPTWFSLLRTGVPVKIAWHQGKDDRDWYGYVHLVSKKLASQKSQPMVVTLLGSTLPMKDRDTRVFTSATASEVAQTLVQEMGFRFIGDPSDRRYSQLTMAGHSYWEFLVELAKKAGFGIWVDGTDFHFRDLTSLINQGVVSAPVLSLGNQAVAPWQQMLSPTLDTFEVTLGDLVETAFETRTVKNSGGVDPLSMKAHFTSQSPSDLGYDLRSNVAAALFQEFRTGEVSEDPQSAAASSRAAASLARFTVPAKATAMGNPRVHPFGSVYLRNTGDETDGYWVVQEVEHIIRRTGGDYTMSLSLLTDGIDATAPSPFRSATPSVVGAINIPAALAAAPATGSTEPVLTSLTPGYGVTNQGYLRTPSRWVAPRRS